MNRRTTSRAINFTILTVSLMAIAVVLAAMLYVTVTFASQAPDRRTKRLVLTLAWTSLAALGGTLLLLMWVVIRWIRCRLRSEAPRKPTPVVDAWAEAGERFQLEEDDEEEGEEGDRGPREKPPEDSGA